MKILLSIKPEYSKKIFSGEKKYEFRKQKPKHIPELVIVYESDPVQKIVGCFSVKRIISGSPKDIWERCKESGGIREEDFFNYCGNKEIIYAFEIDKAQRFDSPIELLNLGFKIYPPQNFTYLNSSLFSKFSFG